MGVGSHGRTLKHGDMMVEPILCALGRNIMNQHTDFSWVSVLVPALEDLAAVYVKPMRL